MSHEQYHSAIGFLHAMGHFDYAAVRAHVDPDYVHLVRPGSLGAHFGHADGLSIDQFVAFGEKRERETKTISFGEPKEVVRGEDKVAIWCESTMTTEDNKHVHADQMFIFKFLPGTKTIVRTVHMADSLLWSKMEEHHGRKVDHKLFF